MGRKCKKVSNTPACIYDEKKELVLEDIKCGHCGNYLRPSITLFGEDLDFDKLQHLLELMQKNRPIYTIVIGTSVRFPYIEMFIEQGRFFESKIIHVNPDPEYEPFVKESETWLKNIENLPI